MGVVVLVVLELRVILVVVMVLNFIGVGGQYCGEKGFLKNETDNNKTIKDLQFYSFLYANENANANGFLTKYSSNTLRYVSHL